MVPTRFAWPYGGHQVYLSGSFTGWTEHLLMTPVEGSSMVFQKICNLAPGYYQYKFLVDGVWRLDEQLPTVTDDYGIVNNVILVKEPDVIPPVLCTESSSPKSIMDVDNGIFRQSVSLLGGTCREVLAKIPDGEIDAFRHRLSVLLLTYTAYELLPESGKVIEFDANLPVQQAFRIMYEQGLAIVPIRDDHNGQFSAMLSASDFILILTELHKNGSMLTKEELEMHSISAWKEGKSQLIGEAESPVNQPFRRPMAQASPNDSLKEVALRILQNKISTIPIIHSPQDGSYPQLLHLASLPGILWHICRHVRHSPGSLPLLQNPVGRLPLGTWMHGNGGSNMCRLTVLPHNAPLSSALTLLIQDQVSSIPVVDDNGSLLDVYSRSDITSLAKGSAYAHIRLDQTSMNQALQLVYEANGGINIHKRCRTCLSSDSLHEVMERLSDPVVRRLIVVEAGSKRVEGIISLRDVFKFLLA